MQSRGNIGTNKNAPIYVSVEEDVREEGATLCNVLCFPSGVSFCVQSTRKRVTTLDLMAARTISAA